MKCVNNCLCFVCDCCDIFHHFSPEGCSFICKIAHEQLFFFLGEAANIVDLLDGCGDELEEFGLGKMLLNLGLFNISLSHFVDDLFDLQPESLHLVFAFLDCVRHVWTDTNRWYGCIVLPGCIPSCFCGIAAVGQVSRFISYSRSVLIRNVGGHGGLEISDFLFDFLLEDSCMLLSWQAGFIEDFSNFQFLDPDDGLVQNVLEISLKFFLPKKELINVVFSALLVFSECLL